MGQCWYNHGIWRCFLKARRESQLRRMYYTAGLGGYTVLGSLGSTRVRLIYQCTNDLTGRHSRVSRVNHYHIPQAMDCRTTQLPRGSGQTRELGLVWMADSWEGGRSEGAGDKGQSPSWREDNKLRVETKANRSGSVQIASSALGNEALLLEGAGCSRAGTSRGVLTAWQGSGLVTPGRGQPAASIPPPCASRQAAPGSAHRGQGGAQAGQRYRWGRQLGCRWRSAGQQRESPGRRGGFSPAARRPRSHRRGQGALTRPTAGRRRPAGSAATAELAIQRASSPPQSGGWAGEKGRAPASSESPPPPPASAAATFPFSRPTWLECGGGEPTAPCSFSLLSAIAAAPEAPQFCGAEAQGPGCRSPPACGAPRTRARCGWLSGKDGRGEGQAAGSLRGSALSSGNRARGSPPAWRARPGAGRKTWRPRPPGVCRWRAAPGPGGRPNSSAGEAVAFCPLRVAHVRKSCLRFGRLGRSSVGLCPEELPLCKGCGALLVFVTWLSVRVPATPAFAGRRQSLSTALPTAGV